MRHVVADEWSRRPGFFQRRDPRVKLVCVLVFLVAVAMTDNLRTLAVLGAELIIALAVAGLPWKGFLLRAAAPLPVAIVFAAATALTGDTERAALLLVRAMLSITSILLLAGTTPMARLLDALYWLRMPGALVEVIQFVYRYLFVLAEQVWRMRNAAAARGGQTSVLAAVSTVRVLFGQAYRRAENIHRAMLARGYSGGPLVPAATYSMEVPDILLAGVSLAGVACALGVTF